MHVLLYDLQFNTIPLSSRLRGTVRYPWMHDPPLLIISETNFLFFSQIWTAPKDNQNGFLTRQE